MASRLFRVALGLSLLTKGICQVALNDRPAQFIDNIPDDEKMALASIVEDNPEDIMTIFKDWQSPEYPLIFRQALPIPPVKQPKQ
jgi:hypothetical protein